MTAMTHTSPKTLSWSPVRKGNIYCSPGCGGGCTWEAYEAAVAHASELCERLGEGFEPRVWENLGWHFEAVAHDRRIRVRDYGYKHPHTVRYHVEVRAGGDQFFAKGDDLDEALEAAKSGAALKAALVWTDLVQYGAIEPEPGSLATFLRQHFVDEALRIANEEVEVDIVGPEGDGGYVATFAYDNRERRRRCVIPRMDLVLGALEALDDEAGLEALWEAL